MKRKIIILIFCITALQSVFSLTSIEDFQRLSYKEQIDSIVEDYKDGHWIGLDFTEKMDIIFESENAQIALDYTISKFKMYRAKPKEYTNNNVDVLLYIIDSFMLNDLYLEKKLFTTDIEKKLIVEYQRLIDLYLKEYTVIDRTIQHLELSLIFFLKLPVPTQIDDAWYEEIYKKYTELGYKGLTIDYVIPQRGMR